VLLLLLAWLLLVAALAVPAAPGIPLELRYRRLAGLAVRSGPRWRLLAWMPARQALSLLPRRYRESLRSLLLQAHLADRCSLIDLVALKLLCSALFALLTTMLWLKSGLALFAYFLPVQAAAGWSLPEIWIRRRIGDRRAAVTREIPPMLSGLAICLQTGISLRHAVAHLSTFLEGSVLGGELKLAALYMDLGATPEEALSALAERCGSEELTRALSAVVQQAAKNPAAAGAAAITESRMAWQRRRRRAEGIAQSASLKLFLPQLLLGLPALMLIVMGPAVMSFLDAFRSFR
jgi:tight adherence protein C